MVHTHIVDLTLSCNIYNNPYLNSGTEDDPRTTMTQEDGQVTTIPGDEATRQARILQPPSRTQYAFHSAESLRAGIAF